MSDEKNDESSAAESKGTAKPTPAAPPSSILTRPSDAVERPGFRNPSNSRSKAQKKKKKKR